MANRIAFFVGDFPSKSETWVYHEIIQLMQEGFEIKVFSIREKKPSFFLDEHLVLDKNIVYRDNFFLIQFAKSLIINLKTFRKIFKEINNGFWNDTRGLRGKLQVIKDLILFINKADEINKFDPDLVIVHFANAKANPVLYYNILSKKPYLLKMHAIDVFNRPNLFRLKVERAYKVLTISNYNINYIKSRDNDIDMSKFIIHHCGIPTDKYEFKSILDRKNKMPTILSVARLDFMKGLDTLIEASYLLHNRGLQHKLIIVGYGEYKKPLVNLSNNLGIQNYVEFKGYCSPEEIKNMLHSSDLFVLSSREEGIPLVLMEAMSTGLPVIGTKISGIPELVEDKINGFLVEPDDPSGLSNKIEEVLKMPKSQLQEIENKARLKIETDFNIVKLTDELKNLIFDTDLIKN